MLLLNCPPDPEKPDAEGRTPIQLASDHGFDDAFQFIMMKSSHAKTLPKTSIHNSDRDNTKAGASSSISCLNPYPIATSSKRRKKNKERTTEVEDEDGVQDPKIIPRPQDQNLASDPDPAKRLRNLRKKLRDTEALEARLLSGEVENPEPEQLEKVSRKGEVEDEIRTLEMSVAHLSVANNE